MKKISQNIHEIKMKYRKKNQDMEIKIPIAVSNKHVHLTKETYETLFDQPLEIDRNLSQVGEFASKQFVTLKTEKNQIEHVRIVGPFRSYNQVEICSSDAYLLGINPPIRRSGDIQDASPITIIGPKGQVTTEACILAQRHIHMNEEEAKKYGLKDKQEVQVQIDGSRGGLVKAKIKTSPNAKMEMHIDRDEANAFCIKNGEEGTLII